MGSTLALIALGSNLGDRSQILDRAIAEIAQSPEVVVRGVSRYHETPPVGGPGGQGAFLNAAAALETTLDPFALHRLLIEVEHQAGRVREVRWDARTLDLDLILFGDHVIETAVLVVPHPRFAVRRFVLSPMAEVAPGAIDPLTGRSVAESLANLDRRPSFVAFDRRDEDGESTEDLARCFHSTFPDCSRIPGLFSRPGPGPDRSPDRAVGGLRNAIGMLAAEAAWLRNSAPDRWLVCPFHPRGEFEVLTRWFDQRDSIRNSATSRGEDPDRVGLAGLEDLMQRLPPPTFIVEVGSDRPIGQRPEIEPEVPRLRPDSADPDRVAAEIRAACEASRTDLSSRLD